MVPKGRFNNQAVIKKNSDIQSIKTEEGIIISRADLNDESIYYLDNPVSIKIWELITDNSSIQTIKKNILSEYNVKEDKLNDDLVNFLQDLKARKLIIIYKK